MNSDNDRNRALLAAIVDSSDDAIISKDLNGIITSWNKAAEEMFGYTAKEAVGQSITMLIPPDHIDEEPKILERIRRGEQIRHYHTVRRARNGELLEISLTVSPVVDKDGKVIGASKIARNIGRERAALEQLRESEERFRVTLSSIGDAVIATDATGRIQFMNSVAEELTAWRNSEAKGKPLEEVFRIVNEYSRKPVESPAAKVLREGNIVGLANHTVLISKMGAEVPIDDSGAPIRSNGSDIHGVVLVFRDVTKRRAAEMAALRVAAIVQNSDDAIISKNLSGIISTWNEGAQRLFGYTAEEVVGKSITLLIPPELRQEEDTILERLRRGERIYHFETTRAAKDGRLIPVSLTISPIKDHEGRIVGVSKIARDIGRERAALLQLRESEERFRVTLGSIGDAVIATDAAGCIQFMNSVAEKLTAWSSSGAAGKPLDEVFKIVNEFTRKPVESPAAKVLREGNIVGLANHTLLISKTGGEVPIDDSGAPIRSDGSAVRGVVLVFRDVTERRAAELAALRLASIVQNSNDAIIGKNLSGVVTTWNEGAERIFGYKANEVIGKSIKVLVPPELQQEEDAILDRLRGGEKIYHFETTRVAKGGRLVPVSLTISPIKDHEGLIVGVSKIARDITEQKKAEALMAKAREQLQAHAEILEKEVRERTVTLEKTIAELEAFSYSLSHDMRAPLRTINSFSEIVLNEHGQQMDEEGREFLKKVIAAARRMDKLILDLLAFTRISRSPVKVEPINVEPLLRGILQERVEFQAPGAEITIESPLAPVLGNETSLTQSFSNLLDNAVKFVEPGVTPRVRIRSEPNGSTVRLWFEDNGIGVDEEGKQRLFQIFERIHSGDYPGFGLGLAIVRKAVERMGGQVGVESEPGIGSRFWLQLPGVQK